MIFKIIVYKTKIFKPFLIADYRKLNHLERKVTLNTMVSFQSNLNLY